jgi:hypothetical protein
MNVAFFTEGGWSGKVPRNHPNMRTDLAWECALEADHHNIPTFYVAEWKGKYDLGIIIVPKKNPENAFECVQFLRHYCKKIAVMQEGPNWYWQDWDLPTQIGYYNLLISVDRIYAHNELDRKYYAGLLDHPDVRVLPTLMIEDAIGDVVQSHDRDGVMIGGNFVSWYGGFDSYAIAVEFNTPIFAPSMGRKQDGEDQLDDISYLPYLTWRDWITELSKRKYAVHLMRTHAAGTFALNCAYLGIPCIGWKGLDTQEICFPKLSFDVGDMDSARSMARHLATDDEFYKHVAAVAKDAYDKHFKEDIFLMKFHD